MVIEIFIFAVAIALILIVAWKLKSADTKNDSLLVLPAAAQPVESFGDYRLMPYCQSEDDYLSKLAHGVCNCWPQSSITRCAEWEPAISSKCSSMPLYRYVSPDMLMGRRFGRINVVARRQLYP